MINTLIYHNTIPSGYSAFVAQHPDALLFHSEEWVDLIKACTLGELFIIAVYNGEVLSGVMPLFISQDRGTGRVANSLPFFGSNGGILCAQGSEDSVFEATNTVLNELSKEWKLRSITLIQSIFDNNEALYKKHFDPTYIEKRLCQISTLPGAVEDLLMSLSPCKRNNVRKAKKMHVRARLSTNREDLMWLKDEHVKRMKEIGGTPKPHIFFDQAMLSIRKGIFTLLMADTPEGVPCAALITATHGKTMEYLFPVTDWELRDYKGLPYLIFESMRHAIDAGIHYYNFGGTWASQQSLYDFKARFGAADYTYNYYTKVIDNSLHDYTIEELGAGFPYYYAIPFSMLRKNTSDK